MNNCKHCRNRQRLHLHCHLLHMDDPLFPSPGLDSFHYCDDVLCAAVIACYLRPLLRLYCRCSNTVADSRRCFHYFVAVKVVVEGSGPAGDHYHALYLTSLLFTFSLSSLSLDDFVCTLRLGRMAN